MTDSIKTTAAVFGTFSLPVDARGLCLNRMDGDEHRACEVVMFRGGVEAVDMILRRAQISGAVGPVGETGDWWADIYVGEHSWTETIALSPEAWKSLKNHWMRCRYVTE